jgi:hypothetical protein
MSKLQLSVPKVLIEPDAKCWLHGLFDMPRVERMRDYTPHVIASNRDRMGSRAPPGRRVPSKGVHLLRARSTPRVA